MSVSRLVPAVRGNLGVCCVQSWCQRRCCVPCGGWRRARRAHAAVANCSCCRDTVPSFKIDVGIAEGKTARMLVAVGLTSNNEMRRSVDSHSESPDGRQRWLPCSTPCLWLSYSSERSGATCLLTHLYSWCEAVVFHGVQAAILTGEEPTQLEVLVLLESPHCPCSRRQPSGVSWEREAEGTRNSSMLSRSPHASESTRLIVDSEF